MKLNFTYIHSDGRSGRGWSVFAAIIVAIGIKEALGLRGKILPVKWQDIDRSTADTKSPPEAKRYGNVAIEDKVKDDELIIGIVYW